MDNILNYQQKQIQICLTIISDKPQMINLVYHTTNNVEVENFIKDILFVYNYSSVNGQ